MGVLDIPLPSLIATLMLTKTHALPTLRRLTAALAAAIPLSLLGHVSASHAAMVISQVYGGGGNSGATYKNDFVELFNNGTSAVPVGAGRCSTLLRRAAAGK